MGGFCWGCLGDRGCGWDAMIMRMDWHKLGWNGMVVVAVVVLR
jgi:hypothetical protein